MKDSGDCAAILSALAKYFSSGQPTMDDWQRLAAALYQACGAYDMPARILDALSAAANGEPFVHLIDELLPVECPKQAATMACVQMDYEARNAVKQGERNDAEDKYFAARPTQDNLAFRRLFCAGFDRGFDRALSTVRKPVAGRNHTEWCNGELND